MKLTIEDFKTLENFPNYRIYKSGIIVGSRGSNLKGDITNRGYQRVTLCYNGKTKRFTVHRLVAITYLGDNPNLVVNHIDGNKTNNALHNLEWCTQEFNQAHSLKNELQKLKGSDNPASKLNNEQVKEIKNLKGKFSQREIALKFQVSKTLIGHIHRGRNWKHIYETN